MGESLFRCLWQKLLSALEQSGLIDAECLQGLRWRWWKSLDGVDDDDYDDVGDGDDGGGDDDGDDDDDDDDDDNDMKEYFNWRSAVNYKVLGDDPIKCLF